MSITLFMLIIAAAIMGLLGVAGAMVYKLATKPKPPKDFSRVQTPPSFKDAEEMPPPPLSARLPESEKTGERR